MLLQRGDLRALGAISVVLRQHLLALPARRRPPVAGDVAGAASANGKAEIAALRSGDNAVERAGAARGGRHILEFPDHLLLKRGAHTGRRRPGGGQYGVQLIVRERRGFSSTKCCTLLNTRQVAVSASVPVACGSGARCAAMQTVLILASAAGTSQARKLAVSGSSLLMRRAAFAARSPAHARRTSRHP